MGDEFLKAPSRIFSTPSWASGAARLVDLGGTFDRYRTSRSQQAADAQALKKDWRAVGAGLRAAMQQADKTLHRTR